MIYYLAAPVLLVQGRRVRASTPRLPEASGPSSGRVPGAEPPVRVAVVGESTAAGVGVERHEEGLAGRLAAEVAGRTGAAVEWSVHARGGYTAAEVRRELLGGLTGRPRPDVVVVAIGVNDLLAARTLARFEGDVTALVHGIRAACAAEVPVILSGMPPLHRFPALPQPTRTLLGDRAQAMDTRLSRVASRLPAVHHGQFTLPENTTNLFAPDAFHPGPKGYEWWAKSLAPNVATAAGTPRLPGFSSTDKI